MTALRRVISWFLFCMDTYSTMESMILNLKLELVHWSVLSMSRDFCGELKVTIESNETDSQS